MKTNITHQRLQKLLSYDENTGEFIWKVSRQRSSAGKLAGRTNDQGYITICIDSEHYRAQRLAWLYVNGEWPAGVIDHINGVRCDNRFENLRDVSPSANAHNTRVATKQNKSTGLLGAHLHKPSGLFAAHIKVNGRVRHIGYFKTAEDAHEAYKIEKRICHADGCTI